MLPPSSTHLQNIILRLQAFWAKRGCLTQQPFDMEMGAGTFHPATFLRSIGPEPWHATYVQSCRRPTDGRYGDNPNRLQRYYQLQVLRKPSPLNLQEQYLDSLIEVGIDPLIHDVRFIEDDWESPTLGAWGLGWEVWLDGMEITQFTYFQQVGGLPCKPISGEITYGLERIAMCLQGVDSLFDAIWGETSTGVMRYGDLFQQAEREMSTYNFELADIDELFHQFNLREKQCLSLLERGLAIPAYEQALQASHAFNLLDARKAVSVNERQSHILRVRKLTRRVAETWLDARTEAGFPLIGEQH